MRPRLLVTPLIAVGLFIFMGTRVFSPQESTILLQDISQKQIIKLTQVQQKKSVYKISIVISGQIDGTAEIQLADRGNKMGSPHTIKGKVDLDLSGDWYENTCLLLYEPSQVTSGTLKIKYKFHTLSQK